MNDLEQRLHEEFAKEPLNLQAITHILKLNTLYKKYGVYIQAIDIRHYFNKYPHNKARLNNAFIESLINLKKDKENLLPEIFKHLGSSFFMENREFAKSTRDKLDELHEAICREEVELSRLSLECLFHLMGPESFHQWTSRVAHNGNSLALAKISTFDRHPHLNLNSDNLDGSINSWVTYTELQEINEFNPFENLVAAIITSKKPDENKIEEFLRAKTLYKNIYGEELNKLNLNKLMKVPALKKALLNLLFESLRGKYNFPQYKNSIGSFWNHFDLESISPTLTADEFRKAVGPHWDSWVRTRLFITYTHRLAEFLSEEERVNLFFNGEDKDELYDALDEINGYHLFQGFSEEFKSIVAEKLLLLLIPKLITVYKDYKAQPIQHITELHIIHTLLVECLRHGADPNQSVTVRGYQTTLFKAVYDLHDIRFLKALLAKVTHFPEQLRLEMPNQVFPMLVHKLHDAYANPKKNKEALIEIKELILLCLKQGADVNHSVMIYRDSNAASSSHPSAQGYATTLFTLVNDTHDIEFLKELVKNPAFQPPKGFTLEYLLEQRRSLRDNEFIRTRTGFENDNHLTQIKLLCDQFPELIHSPFGCQQTTLREWAKYHKDKKLSEYVTSKIGPEKVAKSDIYSKSFAPYGAEEESVEREKDAAKSSTSTVYRKLSTESQKTAAAQTKAAPHDASSSEVEEYIGYPVLRGQDDKVDLDRESFVVTESAYDRHLRELDEYVAGAPEREAKRLEEEAANQANNSSASSTDAAGYSSSNVLAPDSPLRSGLTDQQKKALLESAPVAQQGGLDFPEQETQQKKKKGFRQAVAGE